MSDTEHYKVSVDGSALGALHLMASKGIITLAEDRTLDENKGRLHISSDPNDKKVTLHINPGEDVNLSDVDPPRLPGGGNIGA